MLAVNFSHCKAEIFSILVFAPDLPCHLLLLKMYWVWHRSSPTMQCHPMLNIKSCLARGHSGTNSLCYLDEEKTLCLDPTVDYIWPGGRNILKGENWFVAQIIRGRESSKTFSLFVQKPFLKTRRGLYEVGGGWRGWRVRWRVGGRLEGWMGWGWPLIPPSTLALH